MTPQLIHLMNAPVIRHPRVQQTWEPVLQSVIANVVSHPPHQGQLWHHHSTWKLLIKQLLHYNVPQVTAHSIQSMTNITTRKLSFSVQVLRSRHRQLSLLISNTFIWSFRRLSAHISKYRYISIANDHILTPYLHRIGIALFTLQLTDGRHHWPHPISAWSSSGMKLARSIVRFWNFFGELFQAQYLHYWYRYPLQAHWKPRWQVPGCTFGRMSGPFWPGRICKSFP